MSRLSSSPAITIITPVWNGLPYIKECIESVLAQDFQNWEMVIGDNASTDGTRDYLDALSDPRIRVFKHAENLQIYGNLNYLMRQAHAPVAQMLCADDYLLAGGLSRIVAAWNHVSPEIGLIRFKAPSDDRDHLRSSVQKAPIPPDRAALYFFLFGNMCGNLSNVSVRTALVEELGGFRLDLPFSGDTEFWARLARRHSIQISGESVVHVRRHPGVASNYLNKNGELCDQEFTVMEELFKIIRHDYPEFLLRLHASVTWDTRHRDLGIKKWLFKQDKQYFASLCAANREHDIFLGSMGRWLVYLFTLGGRIGALIPARRILKLARRKGL